jgi:hypothetical protein
MRRLFSGNSVESLEDGRQFSPQVQEQLRRTAREFMAQDSETVTIDLMITAGY